MKIKVTHEDVMNGSPKDRECCPIGLALQRKYPTAAVVVNHQTALINDDVYVLSKETKRFIAMFDDRKTRSRAKPFTAYLDKDS